MEGIHSKWYFLLALALVWGSTFIVMKKALLGIGPYHLGALRIVFTALLLIPFSNRVLRNIRSAEWKWILLSGFLGSFFPAFLIAIAETKIDSAVTSVLNSLVPLNTVLIGFPIFGIASTKRQIVGVIIGFLGTALLISKGAALNGEQNYIYAGFVIISTVMYAANVNIIKRYLNNVKSFHIVVANYISIFMPALLVLYWSNFFDEITYSNPNFETAIVYVIVLAIFGTVLLKVLFYKLIHIATPAFASSVTYLIPLVAIFWGLLDGEPFFTIQGFAALIILVGVFLSHKRKS